MLDLERPHQVPYLQVSRWEQRSAAHPGTQGQSAKIGLSAPRLLALVWQSTTAFRHSKLSGFWHLFEKIQDDWNPERAVYAVRGCWGQISTFLRKEIRFITYSKKEKQNQWGDGVAENPEGQEIKEKLVIWSSSLVLRCVFLFCTLLRTKDSEKHLLLFAHADHSHAKSMECLIVVRRHLPPFFSSKWACKWK